MLLETCKWAFHHPVNEGAVFITHNSSNYDAHFILTYLITNGEYPEILANGGKMLEIKIKTGNAKLIDSCCFIAMLLSSLVTLSIYVTLKGHSPICLMFLIIIMMLDHCLLCGNMLPMG